MEESNRVKEEKEKEEIKVTNEDDFLQDESPSKKRRSNKRNREKKESPDDIHSKTIMVETMGELELKIVELVKDTMP